MIPIKNMVFHINEFSRPGIKLKGVKGIVLHYTASPGASAENIAKYFGRLAQQNPKDNVPDRYASAHFAVDDDSIVMAIPENEMAYHVGSKTYTNAALKYLGSYPNNCTIGIEMCIDKNGNITPATFKNTVDLTVYLCKKYNLNENNLWTHKGVVGWKDCPLPWIKNPSEFERFKKAVADGLRPVPVQPKKEELKVDPKTKEAAIKSIDYLAKKGMLNNPEDWKKKVEEALPVWAYMIMEARKDGLDV